MTHPFSIRFHGPNQNAEYDPDLNQLQKEIELFKRSSSVTKCFEILQYHEDKISISTQFAYAAIRYCCFRWRSSWTFDELSFLTRHLDIDELVAMAMTSKTKNETKFDISIIIKWAFHRRYEQGIRAILKIFQQLCVHTLTYSSHNNTIAPFPCQNHVLIHTLEQLAGAFENIEQEEKNEFFDFCFPIMHALGPFPMAIILLRAADNSDTLVEIGLLLDRYADAFNLNKREKEELFIEACAKNEEKGLSLVKMFVSLGVDFHAQDNKAFRVASSHGFVHLMQFLIKAGADIRANNNEALSLFLKFVFQFERRDGQKIYNPDNILMLDTLLDKGATFVSESVDILQNLSNVFYA